MTDSLPALGYILGGVPTKSQDFAASIVFAVAFIGIVPLAAWRLFTPASRNRILIRPSIFLVLQAAAYILRAVIADGHQTEGLYIASQILLLAGFILICEPIPALLTRVVGKYEKGVEHPHKGQQKILRLLRIILIVALALGISAASMISGSADAGSASTMKDLRVANAVLVILAMGGAMVMTALFFVGNMTPRASLLVAGQGLCILVSAVYKLYSALHKQNPFATSTKVEFYVLNSLLQWIAVLGFFVVNLQTVFPEHSMSVSDPTEYGDDTTNSKFPRSSSTRLQPV